jgi:RNA polymerase sigma-70 factor (ECF subfamily)
MLYSEPMVAAHASPAVATDEELMGRVVAGDVRAFEAIYERHHRQAYSLARRITGAADGAEEATQDAFLTVWRGAFSYNPERGRLAPWLFRLVRNRSIDIRRSAMSRPTYQDLTGAAERLEARERTDQQVLRMQEKEGAQRLVAQLPPEQREVIDLAYFAGYSQLEIAEKVGVPLGTVKGRARLGLVKLREAAERESVLVPAA